MHVNVKSVGVGRVGVCILCVRDSEQRECEVGAGVNATMLSATLYVVGNTCVSEKGGDGKSAGSEALSLLSYTLRYVSLADLGRLCQFGLR